MIRWGLRRAVDRFACRHDYDAGYLKELITADLRGGLALLAAQFFLKYSFGVPPRLYFAAKVRSAFRADCGPCLALCVRMAGEAGVAADQLLPALRRPVPSRAVSGNVAATVAGDETRRGIANAADLDLVLAFTDAVVDNAAELPSLADGVRVRFGERTRAGLAAAIVAGQFYPLLKRALGHAVSCEPVLRDLMAAASAEHLPRSGNAED